MCGRFALYYTKDFNSRYRLTKEPANIPSRYNIAPGQESLVIKRRSPNQAVVMKWGLVPFWAKDPAIGYRMINARAESLIKKPSFRRPLAKQRCLVPANGFYEWKKIDDKTKNPYYIRLKNQAYFSMAGLYDVWRDSSGQELHSFTIITVEPNRVVGSIHNRMPAILYKEDEPLWLDCANISPTQALNLLKPYTGKDMEAYPVSKDVNKPANNSRELIEPADEQNSLF